MIAMIQSLILNIIINGLILYGMSTYVPDLWFVVTGNENVLISFGILGAIFRIINDLIRNILQTITFPLKFVTLGLSSIVINVWLIYVFGYVINTSNIGVSVQLGSLLQVAIMSIIVTIAYFIIKKVL